MNSGKFLLILMVALAVNEVARVRQGKEIVSPIIGTTIFGVFGAILGALWRWDIVLAFGILFLVSSLVINGQPILTALSQLLNGAKKNG